MTVSLGEAWLNSWQDVREEDFARVMHLLSTNTISLVTGGVLTEFETNFASFSGSRYAVAFNNGTASLYAALWAIGVKSGDDVLMADYSFHGMAAAVTALGARVVPCDVDAETLTLDPDDIPRRLTTRTKAILVHNPWGVPADFESIRRATDLPIISDASHAHGATYLERPIADWAQITCFSLGLSKLITGGELGCAVTNDPALRDRMLILGHVNRVPRDLAQSSWRGNSVGLKLRPHPMALGLALPQIERFEQKKTLLRQTCARVEELFGEYDFLPQGVPPRSERLYWRIVLRIGARWINKFSTAQLQDAMRAAGIPVQPNHYWPLLQDQSLFKWPGLEEFVLRRPCPVAMDAVPRTIILPAPVLLADTAFDETRNALEKIADSS